MESYYDSDEEIAWGPVMMREIIGDLKRAANRKPNRRHTVICNFENCKVDAEILSEDLDNKSEEHSPKESPIVPVILITEASPEDNSCQKCIHSFNNGNTCLFPEEEVTAEENVREEERHEDVREDENHFQTGENEITEKQIEEVIVISDDSDTSINSNTGEDLNSDNDVENDENNVFNTPNRQLSIIKETLRTSPVIVPDIDFNVPDIDFKWFDDSSSKDDSVQLNDTLEEIFLCQGFNYSVPDDEFIDNTPAKGAAAPQEIITNVNQLFSNRKEKDIPKGKFAHSEKKTGTVFRTKPMTKKHKTNFKNVVSPVALYIKNSPRVPLVKNVHPRENPKNVPSPTPTSKTVPSNKENFSDFCEVVYKPSKKQIVLTERHIVVPPYMRNLKIKEMQITKHEGRINHKLDSGSKASEQLLQSDITNSMVDESLLDNTGNISVLTSKQAFVK